MTDQGKAAAEHLGAAECRCGHTYALHRHYRTGTDCAACGRSGCNRFRPRIGQLRWLILRARTR